MVTISEEADGIQIPSACEEPLKNLYHTFFLTLNSRFGANTDFSAMHHSSL